MDCPSLQKEANTCQGSAESKRNKSEKEATIISSLLISAYLHRSCFSWFNSCVKIIPNLKSRLNDLFFFLNVKGFVWKTVADCFNLFFPYESLLFSAAVAFANLLRCKPQHFFQRMLFLERVDHMTNGCYRCIENKFSSTIVASTEHYFYILIIFNKDMIIEVALNDS